MALRTLVTSPMPASMDRSFMWGEKQTFFDSGVFQGSSPYVKPLAQYTFQFANTPRSKQSSLYQFYNEMKGGTTPFLFQCPYDYSAPGGTVVRTGTNPSSFMLVSSEGYPIFPKSGSVLITSALSGNLTQNSHWVLDSDRGIIVASMRPSSSDYWTVRSAEYYRKVVFTAYSDNSVLWNNFSANITMREIAIP